MTGHWATSLRALGFATAVGCGSNAAPHTQPGTTPVSMSVDSGVASGLGSDTNPDGVAYPSPPYGRNVRSGTTAGSVMANFKFLGYANAVVAPQPARIALADYYDPCNKRYKLIHLTVASVWCVPCNAETDAFVGAKSVLDADRVVVLQALDDGPILGTGATQGDLDRWIAAHRTNFTELLDPGLQNLSGFFMAAAVPWNCDVDPRTMEIINSATGWATTPGATPTENVMNAMSQAISALPATPSYPSPVTCN